jgi:hypothetical protein
VYERIVARQPLPGGEHELDPAAIDHAQPGVLVVAAEQDHLAAEILMEAAYDANDLLGARAAVDVVAEEDELRPATSAR